MLLRIMSDPKTIKTIPPAFIFAPQRHNGRQAGTATREADAAIRPDVTNYFGHSRYREIGSNFSIGIF
jgi:hypothetical protein